MNKSLTDLCDEIIKGTTHPDAGCVHLSAEQAKLLAEGYLKLDQEVTHLRGTIMEHLPEISRSMRAQWEAGRA